MPKKDKNKIPIHVFNRTEFMSLWNSSKSKIHDQMHKIILSEWKGRLVAIKFFNKELELERFEREKEIHLLARKNHQSFILPCYGISNFEYKSLYIVFPYIPDGNLYLYIMRKKMIKWNARLTIMTGVADALGYLHKNEYVHSDIKSPNILLDTTMKPYLCDFEFTRKRDLCDVDNAFGTSAWVAPEYCNDDFVNSFTSDIYSATVVFWELSAWDVPFWRKGDPGRDYSIENKLQLQQDVYAIYKTKHKQMLTAIKKDCPLKGVSRLINWGWSSEPKDRPTIQQFSSELLKLKKQTVLS